MNMGATKRYLLELSSLGTTLEEADAIEWAVFEGILKPNYDLATDTQTVATQRDEIVEAYRRFLNNLEADANELTPPFEEISGRRVA
jgi:hypothetical protein